MSRIATYIKRLAQRMKHVNWPTRQQTIRFTLLVIAVSLATAALLGYQISYSRC